nr:HEXXH motif-containing putative peptide modification protein [Kineosporia babensis]
MLGRASFGEPGAGTTASVTISSEGIVIRSGRCSVRLPTDPGTDGPGWRSLRRLEVTSTAGDLTVCLDDHNPFRQYAGLDVACDLTDEVVARWNTRLGEAWTLLGTYHPELARSLAAGLLCLVPLIETPDGRGVSATAVNAFGAAAMTPPVDAATLAEGLVHEFQHSKLSALLDLIPLYDQGIQVLLYAPWRDDPRPLPGLLQGTYAYLGVAAFWRQHRFQAPAADALFAHYQFDRWRDQAARAAAVISDSGALTDAGHRFVDTLSEVLASWRQEPVPEEARRAAGEATLDHWLSWRLRNLRPDDEAVRRLADQWHAGASAPTGPVPECLPVAGRFAPVPNDRLTLLHQRLRREPFLAQASPADLSQARGDTSAAAALYRKMIEHDADDTHVWAGLALTSGPADEDAGCMLRSRPEIVRAVHQDLTKRGPGAVDPTLLAGWLGSLETHSAS